MKSRPLLGRIESQDENGRCRTAAGRRGIDLSLLRAAGGQAQAIKTGKNRLSKRQDCYTRRGRKNGRIAHMKGGVERVDDVEVQLVPSMAYSAGAQSWPSLQLEARKRSGWPFDYEANT